ncbi:MAG: GDSL-type esterase/lipase family protein [Pacificibacter sp.]|uniref:SGNH/GDSL hydrolase family protein n=1 Tax=Pacificibacter sp. TaxID=1917866 RepID=UPI00321B97C9
MNPSTRSRLLLAINIVLFVVVLSIVAKEKYWQKASQLVTGQMTPAAETQHYLTMTGIHRRPIAQALAGSDVQIAFIGDSIIEGWLTSAVVPNSMNLGIGRDTIPGLIARTDVELVQHVPVWYVGIGINDTIRNRDADLIQGFVEDIFRLYGPAKKLIWRAALPVAFLDTEREQFRKELNSQTQAACSQIPHCTFLAAPREYADNVSAWTSDGLHPNAEGYRALTDQLCQIVTCLSVGP